MLIPLYALTANAFEGRQDILADPFGLGGLALEPLGRALTNPQFNS